jgi:Asp-tRNA(Asn)/Glu-tRNA(Gln) amidotransferase A subunit family amidase
LALCAAADAQTQFSVIEATIESTHAALRAGEVSCSEIVQQYLERARAYNGVCTALVTEDGADVPAVQGYTRAGTPLQFPTQTVAASTIFPALDRYRGLPLDYGRMETTISNPEVFAQMGMRIGIPDAGQVNALETIALRGERSVTCRGDFDAHPSTGPLPEGAPAVCEEFRRQPDALERAAELDALYGSNPPLDELPMYCIAIGVKDPYDTKDMRSTSNNDVNFAMDAPPTDAPLVAQLREQGAIIFAKTTAHEFNAGPGDPGGDAKSTTLLPAGGQGIGSWGGQACNPYDTERVPRGSSSGSGPAVSANLVMVGICEQTGASCQGPASRNGIALMLTTKGMTPGAGGQGYDLFIDRPGIHTRTLTDAAHVLDSLNRPETGLYYAEDPFTTQPDALVPDQPYASFAVAEADLESNPRPLEGVTIGIVREHMRYQTPNHVAISDRINDEIRTVLRDRLGADLVEVNHPEYLDDPDIPSATFNFADALARILPVVMPEFFVRTDAEGAPMFEVPGWDVTSPEYLLALTRGDAPLPGEVTLATYEDYGRLPCASSCRAFTFDMNRYLAARGDERITDWAAWVANAKFRTDASRAGAENWVAWNGYTAAGKGDDFLRSEIGRMALRMMMAENGIDLFVHPENTVPTPKIQGPNVGSSSFDDITPFLQIPRIVVPAGMNDVIFEPQYALDDARTNFVSILPADTPRTTMRKSMPIAITFFANQGDEPLLIEVGTAYEAATRHRAAPPDFGPVLMD